MNQFSANLRRRAEQLGLSNAEVARRSGLGDRRYANYVSGTREPDLATLMRIANTLGTSVDDLLGPLDKGNVRTVEEQFQERIAAALKSLQTDDLARVAVMVEALAVSRVRRER